MSEIFNDKPSQIINIPIIIMLGLISLIGIMLYSYEREIGHYLYIQGIKLERWMVLTPISIIISLPLIGIIWRLLVINTWSFIISETVLKERKGVLKVRIDTLELFRIKDVSIEKPLLYRPFGLSNVILDTSDKTTPVVVIIAIKEGEKLFETLTQLVRERRKEEGVREIDAE